MDIEAIKAKYLTDDFLSKMESKRMHSYKKYGKSITKEDNDLVNLADYIDESNRKLGGSSGVRIQRDLSASGSVQVLLISLNRSGKVSVPEAQLFIKKLQQAINFIRKAPTAPRRK